MKFYQPGRHQAATQIGTYFALLETIKRYQNEEIEPLGGEQRSRRVALQVLAMFPAWGVNMWVRRLTHMLTRIVFNIYAAKKHRKPKFSMLFGAAGRIRTADLILTK